MFARRMIPFLLIGGAVMMLMQHKRLEFLGQCEEGAPEKGERHHPMGSHGSHGLHGPRGERSEWGKRVPPMFEMWHKRAHEQEQQAQQPAA